MTVTINSTDYTYTVTKTDTLDTIVNALVTMINAANGGLGWISNRVRHIGSGHRSRQPDREGASAPMGTT